MHSSTPVFTRLCATTTAAAILACQSDFKPGVTTRPHDNPKGNRRSTMNIRSLTEEEINFVSGGVHSGGHGSGHQNGHGGQTGPGIGWLRDYVDDVVQGAKNILHAIGF